LPRRSGRPAVRAPRAHPLDHAGRRAAPALAGGHLRLRLPGDRPRAAPPAHRGRGAPRGPRARRRRDQRMTSGRFNKLVPWISTLVSIVVLVVIWKLVIAIFDVSPFVLPQPEDVLRGVKDLVSSKGFWSDVRVTLEETIIGFLIALVLGVALGTLLGR